MSKRIQITEPEERYQTDRKAGLRVFLDQFSDKRHGLQHPNCYLCSEARGDRFIKTKTFEIDFDPESNHIIIKCSCHGDTFEMRQDLQDLLFLNEIDTRMIFKPDQGIRVDGRILAIIPRRHANDKTYAY